MQKILNIVWLNIKLILSDRSELVGILVLPLVFTIVFGVVFGNMGSESKVKVLLVDNDKSAYSKQVKELLKEEESFSVEATTQKKAEDMLSNKEASAAIIVNKDFGKDVENGIKTNIEILKLPDSNRSLAVVEVISGIAERITANAKTVQVVQSLLDEARQDFLDKPILSPQQKMPTSTRVHTDTPSDPKLLALSSVMNEKQLAQLAKMPVKDLPEPTKQELNKIFPYMETNPDFKELYDRANKVWEPDPPVDIVTMEVVASKVRGDSTLAQGFSHSSLGFTLLFVMFIVFGGAQGMLEERELGTLSRLLTTPTTKAQLLMGKIAGLYMTGVLQAIVLITVGALVFNVAWGNDPLPVILIIGLFILATTGIAIFLSAVSRTRGQMIATTNVLVISLAMLGGCFWQIEITPPFMQNIAKFTPTGWAMSGLVDVIVRNQGMSEAVLPSLILAGFALFFFVAGLKFLKFE